MKGGSSPVSLLAALLVANVVLFAFNCNVGFLPTAVKLKDPNTATKSTIDRGCASAANNSQNNRTSETLWSPIGITQSNSTNTTDEISSQNLLLPIPTNLSTVCVLVRTFPGQAKSLQTLVDNLIDAASVVNPDPDHQRMTVRVILADTDPKTYKSSVFHSNLLRRSDGSSLVQSAAEQHNIHFQIANLTDYDPKKLFWWINVNDHGYMTTQYLMDNEIVGQGSASCDWVLITNGDDLFRRYLFQQTLLPYYKESRSRSRVRPDTPPNMILFNFVSHHPRNASDGKVHVNQLVEVAPERGRVDLSSYITQVEAIRKCPTAHFIPPFRAGNAPIFDLFAQDWFFFKALSEDCNSTVLVVPETLLIHQ